MSRVLITGAKKGLGKHAAQRLLADGHDVWIAARDPSRAREAASELGGKHVVLDVTYHVARIGPEETRKLRGKSSHRKKAEMSPCIIKSPLRMICAAPHKKGASNRIDKAGGAKTQ